METVVGTLVAILLAFATAWPNETAPADREPRDLVVLVHGMGRTAHSMKPLERALEKAGYEVLNYGYPSRRHRVDRHGERFAERLEREAARDDIGRIHFVGHSLGCILIRWVIANEAIESWPGKIGRTVMLAPPNQGSRRADLFSRYFSWLSRPLPDLTTDIASTARTIPTPGGVEIGIIAGSKDSIVPVPRTHLDGEADHVVVASGHTFIMRRPLVRNLTLRFLRTGSFTGD